jgi:Zn-dependent M32 family carboxypeptidase
MKLSFRSAILSTLLASKAEAFSVGNRRIVLAMRGGALSISTVVHDETTTKTAYEQLVAKLEAITHLSRASAVLSYDQQVFMPTSASAERGAQLAALATVLHQQKTDPELLKLMDQVDITTLDRYQKRLIELERKSFEENARVPTELAAQAAERASKAYQEWVEARKAKDFSMFETTLEQCFELSQKVAAAKKGDSDNLYDFMLDEFEMGMTKQRIDDLFRQVQETLVPFIEKVLDAKEKGPTTDALHGEFDIQRQQDLSEKLVKAIGFNSDRGRIDVSVHPFTSSMSPSDVRITSRFRIDEWYQGLAGSLHEGGHAIYEQGLPKSALNVDTALSMGTHESQSLFWERHVGLSKAFWNYATPIAHEALPQLSKYSSEELYGAINAVSDESLIRVEADELSYPLHVILRYNIEKDVIGGRLAVSDIPERWNSDMKRYLKVDVPSDDKGCLQDVHWAYMAFGYFPTYLIGAIASAQLFHYCSKDMPDISAQMERGEFTQIKDWLLKTVHQHGRQYTSLDELLEDQLGETLNPKYFLNYLIEKYSDLYKL